MFTISTLYVVSKNRIDLYESADILPIEFIKNTGINSTLYITVNDTVKEEKTSVNLSRWMTDFELILNGTWDDIANSITDSVLIGYGEDVPGYRPGSNVPTTQIHTWDVMNTLNTFDVTYSDYVSEAAGLFALRWSLHDLRIKIYGSSPDLNNVIPVVNGVVCRPVVIEDKLYAINGAKLCWQQDVYRTPEIQLLDTTPLNGSSVHRLTRDDTLKRDTDFRISTNDDLIMEKEWVITSPYSLNEYTPIFVMCGSLILPDEYRILNEHSLSIRFNDKGLENTLAYKTFLFEEPNSKAEIAYNVPGVLDYLLQQTNGGNEKLSDDCFVILVKTPKLYITRASIDSWKKDTTHDLYQQEGILKLNSTNTIRNYIKQNLPNVSELITQYVSNIYLADTADFEDVVHVEPDMYRERLNNLLDSNSSVIYIIGD